MTSSLPAEAVPGDPVSSQTDVLPGDAAPSCAPAEAAPSETGSASAAAQATPGDSATPPTTAEPPRRRQIRSFVTRQGRVSKGQRRALDVLGPRFVLDYTETVPDFDRVFGRHAPRVLEIGFGMGTTTAEIAAHRPDEDFIGVEVHEPGVGALLKLIGDQHLENIRAVRHDAVEVVQRMLAPASLAGVHVFFPDPWHKARHHKRRLIQPAFVALLASRLAPGGYLHCATDWEPYAQQMLEVLGGEPNLRNTAEGFAPRPDYRPVTKFEQRGLRLGHGVWDLIFRLAD